MSRCDLALDEEGRASHNDSITCRAALVQWV
jgi:hypothetical protein